MKVKHFDNKPITAMEQQIINILEKYSIKNSDVTGEWSLLEDDMFPQVAKEIMKLYRPSWNEIDESLTEKLPNEW